MKDIALHILDIVQNSVSAGATLVNTGYIFDTREVKDALEDVPLSEPAVIRYMKEMIEENLAEVPETLQP